jgi:hypothetical protein
MPRSGLSLALLLFPVPLLVGASGPALPQAMAPAMPCGEPAELARQLGDGYDEAPVSLGVQSNGHLLEVFSSPRTGTWTIVSTEPGGLACVVAAGEGWQALGGAGGLPTAL